MSLLDAAKQKMKAKGDERENRRWWMANDVN